MAVDFEIPYATIRVGKDGKHGSFTVRGLNADDVVFLTETYVEDIKRVLAKYGETGRTLSRDRVTELLIDLLKTFPMMAMEIISRCADAPDQVEKFRCISFIKQVEALKAIFDLSAEGDESQILKKAGAVLLSLLEANGLRVGPLTTQLQTIIGQSENPSPA